MPFPVRLLNSDEEVVLDLRPHLWFTVGPSVALMVTFGLIVLGVSLGWPSWALSVLLLLMLATLMWYLGRFVRWYTTNFVVTTDRVIYRYGVLTKQGIEIPLERVNTVHSRQNLFERLLGTGDLMIESGGERGQQHFTDVRRPALVQNEIYRMIDLAQEDEVNHPSHPGLSIIEQIERLEELRQRGIISRAEFDAKKAQLLDRL
jgi:uncharacterized membrane protein YdbT with pleckstrin-like domain